MPTESETNQSTWTPYDAESVYDAEIAPLMAQIIAICKRERIPMVASFQYQHIEDGSEEGERGFCTTSIPIEGRECSKLEEACDVLYRPTFVAFAITVHPSNEKR